MKVDLYTQQGEKNGTLELPKEMFEAKFNKDLIHQTLVRQLANGRIAIAHTKTKGEVSGRGMKPYKQKGTGNARQGSLRNPHMRGGGVSLGPRNMRNFVKLMPKKQRRAALFSALSFKAKHNDIIGLEDYKTDKPKTKDLIELLRKLPIEKDVLIVIPVKNTAMQKSANNIPFAKTILAGYINIQDLQRYDKILIFKDSIAKLKETFFNEGKEA